MNKIDLRFWRNPRIRYGSVSTLLLCLFLAILFVLNGVFVSLEKKNGWQKDYSFNAITTYSEDTQAVLDQLDTPVEIYAMFEYGTEDQRLWGLLDRYSAGSDMITWKHTPLSLNPGMALAYQGTSADNVVTANSLIVYCPETNRFRVLKNFETAGIDWETGEQVDNLINFENEITFAISYVTQAEIPIVYVITGNQEVEEADAADFNKLLRDNHYDVRYTTLAKVTLQPDDLVVFLSPRSDLTKAELQKMSDFVEAGGNILFSCDATNPLGEMPNYRELMRLFGFIPLDGIVLASSSEPGTYDGRNTFNLYVTPEVYAHTYQRMFDTSIRLPMVFARAFQPAQPTGNIAVINPLLYSGNKAYLHSIDSYNFAQEADAPTGPFILGMECTRITNSGEDSRAIVLGATSMLVGGEEVYSNGYAKTFILLVMRYLVHSDSLDILIDSKVTYRPKLDPAVLSTGSMVLVALPLAVLAAALIVLVPRNKEVSPTNAKRNNPKA